MTFAEWVAAGAAFGIKAFFAVFVFVLCSGSVGIVLGLFGLIASFFGNSDDDDVQ